MKGSLEEQFRAIQKNKGPMFTPEQIEADKVNNPPERQRDGGADSRISTAPRSASGAGNNRYVPRGNTGAGNYGDASRRNPGTDNNGYAPRGNSSAVGINSQNRGSFGAPRGAAVTSAMPLPPDCVEAAESFWCNNPTTLIKSTKIHNILLLLTDIYNDESIRSEAELLPISKSRLQKARIRMVYESGREKDNKKKDENEDVRQFIEKAHLVAYLKDIGDSRIKAIQYIQYVEALVAYHKYFDAIKR